MKRMKNQKQQYNSLFRRVFIPMCTLVGVIVSLIIGITIYYNIIGQLNDNSRGLFDQQVTNRSRYLENLMLSKWSNIENDVLEIQTTANQMIEKKQMSIKELTKSTPDTVSVLSEVSDDLIAMLRKHGTTGAYMFFVDEKMEKSETVYTPGFYITDDDPDGLYEPTNADLLVERCPVQMIDELDIPMNSSWKPQLEFHEREIENYNEIFDNFKLSITDKDFSISDVGCWMKPFQIYGSDRYSISYILPLIYKNQIYGAIGIDLSFSYLQKVLPYNELNGDGYSGFVLALKEDNQVYTPLFINGPTFEKEIQPFEKFQTVGTKESLNDNIYCSSQQLQLYNSNTPYANQKWVVMGVVQKDNLYAFANHLESVFLIVVSIVLILGTLLSYILSRYISKPIVDLANYIGRTSNAGSRVNLKRTHIIEIDQLIEAIEKMGNDVMHSASRFTNIIQLANTHLAGFEIDYDNDELFITDRFFDIFLLYDVDTHQMTVEEFKKLLKAFDRCCVSTQNLNEYLYHIETTDGEVYLRLRYYKNNEKYVGLVEEVTDMIKERQVIEHERDYDVLTGLMNRRAFQRKMKRLFTVESYKLKIAALIMMDLDNLKKINDTYGHDCGDSYINAAAKTFEDYTPHGTIVSRTSGDEFYIFMYGYNTREEIEEKMKTLKNAISQTLVKLPNNHDTNLYVSGGVAWYPTDSTRFEELQRYSDYAMYSVKRSVKGKIESFNLADYESNVFVTKRHADYRELIENKQYTFYFQPIVDASTGEIFAYESLMRSLHPSFKDPKEIISLAKLEGELHTIEFITWQGALELYNQYYQEGIVNQKSKVFINSISSQTISDENVYELEAKTPDILDKVVLEVTEEEESNENTFNDKVSHLQRWHGEIALDDYGSGYNSERNLLLVNPKYVKIDIDIIRDIDKDIDKQKLVENIISYCHERDKKIIAEGVETIQELRTVLYLGVDYIQGFFFARAERIPPQINPQAQADLLEIVEELSRL